MSPFYNIVHNLVNGAVTIWWYPTRSEADMEGERLERLAGGGYIVITHAFSPTIKRTCAVREGLYLRFSLGQTLGEAVDTVNRWFTDDLTPQELRQAELRVIAHRR